jgi:hypothetical protein
MEAGDTTAMRLMSSMGTLRQWRVAVKPLSLSGSLGKAEIVQDMTQISGFEPKR